MRNKMLRSVLVAAFSAVVAIGALTGLSGAKSDAFKTGGAHFVAAGAVGDETPAFPLDSTWD
jgi:hypothetical protein